MLIYFITILEFQTYYIFNGILFLFYLVKTVGYKNDQGDKSKIIDLISF
jgi:hypothetical protein